MIFLEGQWLQKIVSKKAACDQRENCPESRLPVTFTSCGFSTNGGVDTGENWPITGKERRVSTFAELGGKLVEVSQSFTLFGTIIFLYILKTTSTHTKSTDKILEAFKKNYSSHAIVSLSQLTLGTGPLSAVILDELVQKVHLCRICL